MVAGHSQQEGGAHKDLSMVTYSTAFGVSGVIVGVVVGALSAAVITCKVTRYNILATKCVLYLVVTPLLHNCSTLTTSVL